MLSQYLSLQMVSALSICSKFPRDALSTIREEHSIMIREENDEYEANDWLELFLARAYEAYAYGTM